MNLCIVVVALWSSAIGGVAAQIPVRLIETEALEITDNARGDRSPTCNGRYVLWSTHDGKDAEIMLMDLATRQIRSLTQNAVEDVSPAAGERYAVWLRKNGTIFKPVIYDFLAQTEKEATWNEPVSAMFPAVHENTAVWQAGDSSAAEIYLYHIPSKTVKRLTKDNFYDGKPSIWGENVVWNASAAGDFMVMHYSLKDGRTKRISPAGKPAWGASVSTTHAAWQSEAETFVLYNLETQKTEKFTGETPVMWHDTLLFCGVGAERGTLYLMRLTDMQTQKVEADVKQLYETCFCGSAAVWRYFDGRDHEIGGLKWKMPETSRPVEKLEEKAEKNNDVPVAPPSPIVVQKAPSALIYPNPADRLVSVTLEPGVRSSAQVTLFSSEGKAVKKALVPPLQTETFELSPTAASYLLEIKVEGQTYVKRVWVKSP